MPNYPDFSVSTRVTASGYTNICAVNARVQGILFTGSGTASAQLFHGVTASGAMTGIIRAHATVTATLNEALYVPCPAYGSGGITINVGSTGDPDVTLFWSPV